MNDNSQPHEPGEAGVIGWVCTADGLLAGLIVALVVAVVASGQIHREENPEPRKLDPAILAAENVDLKTDVALLTGWVDELVPASERQAAELADLKRKVEELSALLAARDRVVAEVYAALAVGAAGPRDGQALAAKVKSRLEELRAEITRLVKELEDKKVALAAARVALGGDADSRTTVRQELLGLRGSLKRVVILLDRSGSMDSPDAKSGLGGMKTRWEYCKGIIRTWLKYLDMEECVLIVFSDGVERYPPGRGVYKILKSEEERRELLRTLEKLPPPGGATNTLGALWEAYDVKDATSIILFTDGKPEAAGSTTKKLQSDIVSLVQEKSRTRNLPINTVGLGNYNQEEGLCTFLMNLADISGGVFIGR
jgi:hypothetical protein